MFLWHQMKDIEDELPLLQRLKNHSAEFNIRQEYEDETRPARAGKPLKIDLSGNPLATSMWC